MNSDDIIKIDHTNIKEYLKHRPPYLFIDEAEIVAGKSTRAKKYVSGNEWYFQCHFPDNPIMPGALQAEAIMQAAALSIHVLGSNIDYVYANKFETIVSKPVHPGCVLIIETNIETFKRGIIKGNGTVHKEIDDGENELVCQCNFTMLVPSEIAKIFPSSQTRKETVC